MADHYKQIGGTVLSSSAIEVGGNSAYRVDAAFPIKMPDGTPISARQGLIALRFGDGMSVIAVTTSNDEQGVQIIGDVLNSVRRI